MKKILLSLLSALLLMPFAANAVTYTVAGSAAILNGTESWAPGNTDNDMVTEDGVNYALVIKGISVEAGKYEFKVVQDHGWENNWPSSNWILNINETAKFDITYTFNAETKDIDATYTKVGEFDGSSEHTYTVAGAFQATGDASWQASLFGEAWNPSLTANDMVKGEDGIYRLVKEPVALEVGNYQYKVVKNHDWGTAYPSQNASFDITEAGNYRVVFTFNEKTEAVAADVTGIVEPATVLFDFADPNFREDIGEAMTDPKGYIYNETYTINGTSLQITAGSAPSRIYKDNNRGQCLVTYKEYCTLTFKAPWGKAIKKIEFTAAGNSNINNFSASTGTIEGMTWTGNAEGVRFLQGGTSYLANAIVTLGDGAEEGLAPIDYIECGNIAEFNALENGTYAIVTLTDAEVIGKSADDYSTVWIQDATGGCWIQYTSLNVRLEPGTKVNGGFYVVKRTASGNPQMKEAEGTVSSAFQTEGINEYTIADGATIAAVNTPENLNRVVRLTGATLEMTSASAGKLTLGEETINVNNGTATANQQLHKIAEWAKDTKMDNVIITAILVATSATDASKNQLLPIFMEEAEFTVAGAFNTPEGNIDDPIFGKTWNPELETNDMTRGEDGIYTLTKQNVELKEAGSILYKVVKNHSWYTDNWGFPEKDQGNADYYVENAGTYDITFLFSPFVKFDNGYHVDCQVTSSATGIETVNTAKVNAAIVYNLQGIRLSQPQRGLNIVNGKKYIVK